jgi:hypothetical protein
VGQALRLSLSVHLDEPRLRSQRNYFRPVGLYVAPADDGGSDGSGGVGEDDDDVTPFATAVSRQSIGEQMVRCPDSHPMVPNVQVEGRSFPAVRNFGACDVCEDRGTTWRCQKNCDFDLCDDCHRTFPLSGKPAPSKLDVSRMGVHFEAVPHESPPIRQAPPVGAGCFGSDFAATRQMTFDVPTIFRGPGRWVVLALPHDSTQPFGSGKFWLGATVQHVQEEMAAAI